MSRRSRRRTDDPVRDALLAAAGRHCPGSALLVAFSGGSDSTVLLHAAAAAAARGGFGPVRALHVDHALRPESGAEADSAARTAASFGVPFAAVRLGPLPPGENLEAWARRRRYAALGEAAAPGEVIVTAHTEDDAAETLLMRLCAGREPRPMREFDPRRRLLRPLLTVARRDVARYAARAGLVWSEDPSNSDPARTRSRVRNEVLPLLEEVFGRGVRHALGRRSGHAARDDDLLFELAAADVVRAASTCAFGGREWYAVVRAGLRRARPDARWLIAESLLLGPLGSRVGRAAGAAAADVLSGDRTAADLPGGVRITRRGGRVVIPGGSTDT